MTSCTISRQLDKCGTVNAEDLLEENVIRLATSAWQKDVYLCRIELVLYSAPPVNSGFKVKEDLVSISVHEEEPVIPQAVTYSICQRD